ncbi:MarR family winged helix-turn-helix transcriptional regulator [Cytobacillus gottheilii]|uniref:MarR family winged helix-turn-helix transcriptional regulator n=1 Tax=Cytobacillus gottheilii TaxID=859144 RepID=UPI0009BB635E|nr:MarR family transcriptional regulator [Cytobacillus gottheilii]
MDNSSELFHGINQFSRHFSKLLNERLVPLGLYSSQWSIIYLLHTKGPQTQKEIAAYLAIEAPSITRAVARLEKAGFIEKAQGIDKREKRIMLSAEAIAKFPIWLEEIKACEQHVLSHLTEDEFQTVLNIVHKMNSTLL